MKTLVVVSDSHGNRAALDRLNGIFAESDYIVHLGDTSADGNYVKRRFPEKTLLLNGNCDLPRLGEDELIIQAEGVKIFACHGDRYGVKTTLKRIADKAEREGCSVALFGHSHRPVEERIGGVCLFNPGTLSRYSRNTYLYLVVEGEKVVGKIVEI